MLSAGASAAGKAAFTHPPKESIETGSGFSYKYITEKVKQSGKAVTFNVQEFSDKRGKKRYSGKRTGTIRSYVLTKIQPFQTVRKSTICANR